MSDNLKQTFRGIKFISNLPPAYRKDVLLKLVECDECYYKALKEIAKNIVNNNIKVKTKISNNAFKNIKAFTKAKKTTKLRRVKLVEQSGGWIWGLIPIVTSIIEALT